MPITWTTKVDGVDTVHAADINNIQVLLDQSVATTAGPTFAGATLSASLALPASVPGNTYGIYEGSNTLIRIFEPIGSRNITPLYIWRSIFIGNAGNNTMGGGVGLGCKVTGIGDGSCLSVTAGNALVGIGTDTLKLTTNGDHCVAIGDYCLAFNVSGTGNTAVGTNALRYAVAVDNVAVGLNCMMNNTGGDNVGIGAYVLQNATVTSFDTAVGFYAENSLVGGTYHTAIGAYAFAAIVSQHYGTALGYMAGAYETGGSSFYLDGLDRGTIAAGKTNSMIYGVLNATPASQILWFNAQVGISVLPSYLTDALAGTGGLTTGQLYTVTGTSPLVVAAKI